MELPIHELVAYNSAVDSENLVHDDTIAAKLGFVGGLVPGVDVFAYLCQPMIAHWGRDFFISARVEVRLKQPVYDGDTVVVSARFGDGGIAAVASTEAGERATAHGTLIDPVPDFDVMAAAPLPDRRPPASPESLGAPGPLGALHTCCSAEDQIEYLLAVRDAMSPVIDWGWVHPGWLLSYANHIISRNVRLGPWIHVGSSVQHHSPALIDEALEVRGAVRSVSERKGHRFVDADVAILGADGRVVISVAHTAIFEPRQLRSDLMDADDETRESTP